MNLTNDEATKVIEALERAKEAANVAGNTGGMSRLEWNRYTSCFDTALAILQAAKDRQQPEPVAWMDEFGNCLSVTQLSLTDKKVAQHYTTPLYTHPPQPAVDKLIEAGNLLESATRQAYADNECPQEQINNSYALNAWTAAKSAAPASQPAVDRLIEAGDAVAKKADALLRNDPVPQPKRELRDAINAWYAAKCAAPVDPSTKAEPYRVEWSGENRTARVVGPKFTGPWKKEASAVHQCADMNQAFAQGGTKATVNPPKVLTDEAMEQAAMDSMAQVVDGKRTYDHDPGSHAWEAFKSGLRYARDNGYLAPAKVDVDAVARELHGAMVAKGIKFSDEGPLPFEDDFRARLTKLFNA
jgi:hypothetical protein